MIFTILCEPCESRRATEATKLGRRAAAWALELGKALDTEVLRDSQGVPVWPVGWSGSISHTTVGSDVVASAVVMPSVAGQSIGLDIESYERQFNPQIWKRIASAWEVRNSSEETRRPQILQLFSAKEAVYKAIFPRVRKSIGFRQVSIVWSSGNSPAGELQLHGCSHPLSLVAEGHVEAGAVLPVGWQAKVRVFSDGKLLLSVAHFSGELNNTYQRGF